MINNCRKFLILVICILSFSFGELYTGLGIEMTTTGAGIYYNKLELMTHKKQLIGNIGIHFNQNLNNHYGSVFMDIMAMYRMMMFSDLVLGAFSPGLIIGLGGISNVRESAKTHILDKWMINYMFGIGFQFYNANILNDISFKYSHSKSIEHHAALHLAFYW